MNKNQEKILNYYRNIESWLGYKYITGETKHFVNTTVAVEWEKSPTSEVRYDILKLEGESHTPPRQEPTYMHYQ